MYTGDYSLAMEIASEVSRMNMAANKRTGPGGTSELNREERNVSGLRFTPNLGSTRDNCYKSHHSYRLIKW